MQQQPQQQQQQVLAKLVRLPLDQVTAEGLQ
jgi:hypothetical protein